ncbi:MAG TPA: hypothetical protein VLX56_05025 [Nitrososphaerales archaeon]|nr:hypothetical protein [Nitrososphaerales archaeon]
MAYAELFGWWIATISWSIAFPIAVSLYLYRGRKRPRAHRGRFWLARDFVFVWFLLGLLAFYVVVVGEGSPLLFAMGNVAVEFLLLIYVAGASRGRW